jgi:hypothetical protein
MSAGRRQYRLWCEEGHPLASGDTTKMGECRQCNRDYGNAKYHRKNPKAGTRQKPNWKRPTKAFCKRGHALTPANRLGGVGQCKQCHALWQAEYNKTHRQKYKPRKAMVTYPPQVPVEMREEWERILEDAKLYMARGSGGLVYTDKLEKFA